MAERLAVVGDWFDCFELDCLNFLGGPLDGFSLLSEEKLVSFARCGVLCCGTE